MLNQEHSKLGARLKLELEFADFHTSLFPLKHVKKGFKRKGSKKIGDQGISFCTI